MTELYRPSFKRQRRHYMRAVRRFAPTPAPKRALKLKEVRARLLRRKPAGEEASP
jgi:hypothetical protein